MRSRYHGSTYHRSTDHRSTDHLITYHCIDIYDQNYETMLSGIFKQKIYPCYSEPQNYSQRHYFIINEKNDLGSFCQERLVLLYDKIKTFNNRLNDSSLSMVAITPQTLIDKSSYVDAHGYVYIPTTVGYSDELRKNLSHPTCSSKISCNVYYSDGGIIPPIPTGYKAVAGLIGLKRLVYNANRNCFTPFQQKRGAVGKANFNHDFFSDFWSFILMVIYEELNGKLIHGIGKDGYDQMVSCISSYEKENVSEIINDDSSNISGKKRQASSEAGEPARKIAKKLDNIENHSNNVRSTDLQSIDTLEENDSAEIVNKKQHSNPTFDPISIHSEAIADRLKSYRDMTYMTDTESHSEDNQLIIASVAVLRSSTNKKDLGVFAGKKLHKGKTLGVYIGEIKKTPIANDGAYVFGLSDDADDHIDASKRCNWTAFVNSTTCQETANVTTTRKNEEITYKTCKTIDENEQLLIYYGDYYKYDSGARFLKTTDTSQDSSDIIDANREAYADDIIQLSRSEAIAFGISPDSWFKIPRMQEPYDQLNPELPLLTWNSALQIPLTQDLQENFTQLMYACATNDEGLIDALLTHGANPNIQSTISGSTALHVTIRSSLDLGRKKNIIAKLLDQKASLALQDKDNQSVLHSAIESNDADDLIPFIMEQFANKVTTKNKSSAYEEILSYVNNNDLDPFLYSLSLQRINSSIALVNYLKEKDIIAYLSPKDDNHFRDYILAIPAGEGKALLLCELRKKFQTNRRKTYNEIVQQLNQLFDNVSLVDFHPRPQENNNTANEIREKGSPLGKQLARALDIEPTGILQERQKSRSADTSNRSTRFFSTSKISFDDIIGDSNNKPTRETIKELGRYFSRSHLSQQNKKNIKNQLTVAAGILLDHACWYMIPYCLSFKPDKKALTGTIYLTHQSDNNSLFNCIFQNLDGEKLECTIEFDPPKTSPSLEDVLAAISSKSKQHNISDQKRLEYAKTSFDAAQKYINALKRMGGNTSNLRTKIDDAHTLINSLCNAAELPSKP
jgi:hypothetical protein